MKTPPAEQRQKVRKTERPNIYLWEPFFIKIDKTPILQIIKKTIAEDMEFYDKVVPK